MFVSLLIDALEPGSVIKCKISDQQTFLICFYVSFTALNMPEYGFCMTRLFPHKYLLVEVMNS